MKSDATNNAEAQAWAQYESIAAMVAALDCDYSRLEDLRDEKAGYVRDFDGPEEENTPESWVIDNPDESEELTDLENVAGDCTDADDARQRIEEDALSVEVRSDWVTPGEDMEASEFRIVLCTGGPHVEIVGDLDHYKQPCSVRILYKDWGTHGELFGFDRASVLRYCSVFFFGE